VAAGGVVQQGSVVQGLNVLQVGWGWRAQVRGIAQKVNSKRERGGAPPAGWQYGKP